MNSIEQAKELKHRIDQAIQPFYDHINSIGFKESEVVFRYQALHGILLMALNDVETMIKLWEKDAIEEMTNNNLGGEDANNVNGVA